MNLYKTILLKKRQTELQIKRQNFQKVFLKLRINNILNTHFYYPIIYKQKTTRVKEILLTKQIIKRTEKFQILKRYFKKRKMLIYKLGFLQTLALKKEENNKLIKLHKKKNFLQKKILHLISNKTLNNVNYITQKPINIGVPTIQLINYNKFYIKNFQKEKNYLKIKYEKERDQFKNKKKLIRLENE